MLNLCLTYAKLLRLMFKYVISNITGVGVYDDWFTIPLDFNRINTPPDLSADQVSVYRNLTLFEDINLIKISIFR